MRIGRAACWAITIDATRLTAEVNSEARADAAAKAIEPALGERAEFQVTQVQSMEKTHRRCPRFEHGYECDEGILYFAGSRERVRVGFDEALVEQTLCAIHGLRGVAMASHVPPPLEDSPKCPRCSLAGICLPDEIRFLSRTGAEPRPLFPALDNACRCTCSRRGRSCARTVSASWWRWRRRRRPRRESGKYPRSRCSAARRCRRRHCTSASGVTSGHLA